MISQEEQDEAVRKHRELMTWLQDCRRDAMTIFDDTINRHYSRSPESLGDLADEKLKLRDDLREIERRIDRTSNAL